MKNCVFCNSEKIVKCGKHMDNITQRYLCRDCKRRFTEKTNPNIRIIINGEKYCTKCKKFKSLSEFPSWNNKLKSNCKKCVSDTSKSRYYNHNISQLEFNNLLIIQENKCDICNKEFKSNRHTFIDHDHITNNIRGLLCPKCNNLLGNCNDDIEILKKAIYYIEKYKFI